MTLHCPRCDDTFLEAFTRYGAPGALPMEADMCLTCGGLWLDAGEVADAYPGLRVLEDRRADVLAIGREGAGIQACPRCERTALEIPFFDVKLDLCPDCFGVWIDGDEVGGLSRTMDRGDGLPIVEDVVRGYRTAAATAMTKSFAKCVVCELQVPLRSTRATPRGAVCDACAKQLAENEEMNVGDDESVVPEKSAAWQFVCDVGSAIGAILQVSARCPSCGHRRTSGCAC